MLELDAEQDQLPYSMLLSNQTKQRALFVASSRCAAIISVSGPLCSFQDEQEVTQKKKNLESPVNFQNKSNFLKGTVSK